MREILINAFYIFNRADLFLLILHHISSTTIQESEKDPASNGGIDKEKFDKEVLNVIWEGYTYYEKVRSQSLEECLAIPIEERAVNIIKAHTLNEYLNTIAGYLKDHQGGSIKIETDRPEDIIEWLGELPNFYIDFVIVAVENTNSVTISFE